MADSVAPGVAIIANGSLARKELTSDSDFDAYVLLGANSAPGDAPSLIEKMQKASKLRAASDGGAFGQLHEQQTLIENIGGQQDANDNFTRRMLFVLESMPLAGNTVYESCVEKIVNRYVSEDITEHQLGRFLLNDVVRFYRTMCVDFEFKTHEQKKEWGIRNIKLVFSRKLMYFSGVVMCAELAGHTAIKKRKIMTELILMTPIDRLWRVMGGQILPALRHYEQFLSALDDRAVRGELKKVKIIRKSHTPRYRELKDVSHHFSWALVNALRIFYPPSHPIHDALVV